MHPRPGTLGALKAARYEVLPVKAELRRNLIAKLGNREPLFEGIVGYEETVLPQLQNALLGAQDVILLGERGQAKSRILRGLTALLDEYVPVLADVEIPENPYAPITEQGKAAVAEGGDDTPLRWMHRDERYGEKLATPDITIADLIGEVDPIKVAEGRYLSDAFTIHFGLVPRMNRGIFAINELPDLAERIQVGLLNVLEERDVQIRGHKVRLPLDVFLVATANPEDYTNRGRIITPLKDRYGAQIRTHYPETIDAEIAIMEQEAARLDMTGYRAEVPSYMREIVAEVTHHARRSPDVNQRSGVSVRASVSDYEALLANAFRRALRLGETDVTPRISDLPFMLPALQGKLEFEAMDEGQEDKIAQRILNAAVKAVFDRHFDVTDLENIALAFSEGLTVDVGEAAPTGAYAAIIERVEGLGEAVAGLAGEAGPGHAAAAVEFVLEGLHLHKLLNKHRLGGQATFTG